MMVLIVHSKQQFLLDQFFNSLLPTIGEDVKVYAIVEDLRGPEDHRVQTVLREGYRPNHYYNWVMELEKEADYFGIVNDDIIFSNGWYEEVMLKLNDHECVSPGFYEGRNPVVFEERKRITAPYGGVIDGMFDAFYIFRRSVLEKLGWCDESVVEWYDIDWYLRMTQRGIKSVTLQKVSVMHLKDMTRKVGMLNKKGIKDEILERYGYLGLRTANKNNIALRRYFKTA